MPFIWVPVISLLHYLITLPIIPRRFPSFHLSYLKEIYASYDMEFPADESASHIVIPDTLLEAAQTGVQAEIDNIDMYEKFLTYDLPDSVKDVFTILMEGSQNHLKAFQKQVDKLS